MTRPTVVLVHGGWCGQWVFWKLGPCLDERGIRWVGSELPTCRSADSSIGPFDDITYLRELVEGIDGQVILAGKSYGGTVITGAAAKNDAVSHLIYIAAMMPAAGEGLQRMATAAMTPEFRRGVSVLADGRLLMDPEVGAACAFSQATEDDRDVWRRMATPMSVGADPAASLDHVGWESTPSTYIVCTEDKAIHPAAQYAWADRATNVVERPWDHSPGVSHPAEVADLIAQVVDSV